LQKLIRLVVIHISAVVCGSLLVTALAVAPPTEVTDDCDACHGENGISTESDVPTIGGESAFVIEDDMFSFRNGERPCRKSTYRSGDTTRPVTDMCVIVQGLSENEITEIAEYYAALEFVPAVQEFDSEMAAAGEKIHLTQCARCHADGGTNGNNGASVLGGQWIPYLEQAFADYASGEREAVLENMQRKMVALDAASTAALIQYYASQQ